LLQSALHDIVVPRARSTRFGCRRCADHNFDKLPQDLRNTDTTLGNSSNIGLRAG